MSDNNDNVIYTLNEAQTLLLCMRADTAPAIEIRTEMIAIIQAWHRGSLLPRHKAPVLLNKIYSLAHFGPRPA